MNVQRAEPEGFRPIVITLETEEEVEHFHSLLKDAERGCEVRDRPCHMLETLLARTQDSQE
jgi:hypothetical protein